MSFWMLSSWHYVSIIIFQSLNGMQPLAALTHDVLKHTVPPLFSAFPSLWLSLYFLQFFRNIFLLFVFTFFLWSSTLSARKWFTEFVSSMQCDLTQHCIFLMLFPLLMLFPFYLTYHLYFFDSSLKENHFPAFIIAFYLHCQLKLVPKTLRNLFFVNNNKNLMNNFIKFFWGKNNSSGEITVQSLFSKGNI